MAYKNNAEIIEAMVAHPGLDVNARDHVRDGETNGPPVHHATYSFAHFSQANNTALATAASNGHVEALQALLSHPAVDVNAQDTVRHASAEVL